MLKSFALAAAVAVALSTGVLSASAQKAPNYTRLYNRSVATYQSYQHVAGAHDSFVHGRRGQCGAERSKWWPGKARKDVRQVNAILNRLRPLWKSQRKHQIYRDTLRLEKHLKGWGGGQILPKLGTCRVIPKRSIRLESDLNQVADDLGIPHGY